MLTTVFLWQWASEKFPEVAQIQIIIILLASTIASVFVINMASEAMETIFYVSLKT